jgi:phosphate transport system protein
MTKHFHNEIDRLKKKILHVAAMVEESLRDAVRSVAESDMSRAENVIQGDQNIDSLEVEVEEDCLKILALHQPVAADLRYVIAVLKINNDLERIADLAVNIAERTMTLAVHNHVASPFDLSAMLDATVKLVRMSVDALVERDTSVAHQVCRDDDLIDDFHKAAYAAFKQQIKDDPEHTEYYISLLSVSRNLERIADHATNIAEDVIYMIEGEIVRHQGSLDRA